MSFSDVSGFTLPMPVTSPTVLSRLFADRHGTSSGSATSAGGCTTANLINHTVSLHGPTPSSPGTISPRPAERRLGPPAAGWTLELRTLTSRAAVTARLMEGGHRVSRGYVVAASKGEDPVFVALGTGDGEWYLCGPLLDGP